MPGFGQTVPSTIDLTVINASAHRRHDGFVALQNVIVDGPPRVLLDQVTTHLKHGCSKIISLSIGGATSLSPAEDTAPVTTSHIAPLSQNEMDSIEEQVKSDTSTELIRMDFVSCHWKSSFNIIRGGYHHKSIERALILVDDTVKAGCFKLEALSAVRDWCTVTIDTDLTKEELRAKGFRWHGLEAEDVPDEDQCIVMPGWSRADDGWEDEDSNWIPEQREWRDL